MEYVYKYISNSGDTVYIGITNDIDRRVREHKSDKLNQIKNPKIYFFPVKYRADAEMLETYLINWYRTKRYGYNVRKTKKGDYSFLDVCDDFPWVLYGSCDIKKEKPFVISDVVDTKEIIVEKEIEKKIYIKRPLSLDEELQKRAEETFKAQRFIKNQIDTGYKHIEHLVNLSKDPNPKIDQSKVQYDLYLIRKRVKALKLQSKYVATALYPGIIRIVDKKRYNTIVNNFKRAVEIGDNCCRKLDKAGRIKMYTVEEIERTYGFI